MRDAEPAGDPHRQPIPNRSRLDPRTQTLYTANQVDNNVSVIDATRCNAQTTSGCRQRVPEVTVEVGRDGRRPRRRHRLS